MATLSIPGLGSNLPIDTLITGLMNVEKQPLTQLDAKTTSYQNKLSALGQVQGSLASFQAAAIGLQNASNFSSTQATSSLSDVASISASDKAAAGSYALSVQTLAQNQKLATAAFSSATSVIGGGTLTFSFGTTSTNGTPPTTSFTPNPDKIAQTVTIPANATLNDVRDAVNAAKIGVTASIVNDGTGYRLVYTSADTGAANSLKIVNSNDSGVLAGLAHDPAGSRLTEVQAAQDAKFTLDGISITKPSNTVSDAIDGLTLTLKKAQASGDAPAQLTVSKDTSGIKSTLNAFVKAYNTLNSTLTSVSAVDTSTPVTAGTQRATAPLNGDTIIRSIQSQIRGVFNKVQSVGGAFRVPAEVGLGFDKDGNMTLDSTKLQKAIDTSPQDIAKLFGAVGTPSDAQVSYVSSTSKTAAGSYAVNVSGLQHGVLSSAAVVPSSLTLPSSQPFSVSVDGVTSSLSLSLPANTYSPASLATALQTAINGDSALVAAGAKVSVTVDSASGKLLISSNKTGTASTVQVTSGLSVDANMPVTLFADGTSGTAGQASVSGTLGGYAAVGDGTTLTGSVGTPVEGLKISVDGGGIGDRGTVTLTRGFAFDLDKVLSGILDSKNGLIASKTAGLNSSIKTVADQRDALNRRLTDIEARYRKQFNALDSLVSQLNNTGTYLTQQLASLPGSSSSKSS